MCDFYIVIFKYGYFDLPRLKNCKTKLERESLRAREKMKKKGEGTQEESKGK